jgi:FkbM family methyltransferase
MFKFLEKININKGSSQNSLVHSHRKYTVNNYLHGDSATFFCFDGDSDVVCNEIKKGNIWEPELHNLLVQRIHKDDVVIEAGTHIGTHTILISRIASKVIGFEPFPETYQLVKRNLELNNSSNVLLFNKALSNEIKTLRVEYHDPTERNIGGWGIKFTGINGGKQRTGFIDVDVITIDSLDLDKLDFIKLDVESEELNVILGAIDTIKKFKPLIILEDWYDYPIISLEGTTKKFNLLMELGYKISQPNPSSPDFLFEPI